MSDIKNTIETREIPPTKAHLHFQTLKSPPTKD